MSTHDDLGTQPLAGERRRVSPVAAIIRVLDAEAQPRVFRLQSGSCRIGSAPGCDVVIQHPTVSRHHVDLSLVAEGVSVSDLGSRNGTFYLDQRIEKATLNLGARLRLGAANLLVDADVDSLSSEYTGSDYFGALGASAAMRKVFGLLSRLEGSLVTVLIEGASGVGKNRIARALHEASRVAEGPLVTLNCGAIPRELVASELFGHKKGAFTGAVEARRGAFESAEHGTLFLDEISELPIAVQPMLLHVLETSEVRSVGSDTVRRVSVRVIAATNRSLEQDVSEGRFREDLFYRLAVVRIRVPSLAERPEDVDVLARAFGREAGLNDLPEPIVAQLRTRSWAGNARELRNAVHAYAALGALPEASRTRDDLLDAALRQFVDVQRPYQTLKDQLQERFIMAYLQRLLVETEGNQAAAARLSGLDRSYIGRLVAKLGISTKPRSRSTPNQ